MTQSFPPGQGPVDPRSAFAPPPPPGGYGSGGEGPPGVQPTGWMPPGGDGGGGFYEPLPQARSGGFFRAIIIGLAAIALVDLILINLGVYGLFRAAQSLPEARQITVVDGSGSDIVAAVPINGLITDDSARLFDECLTAVGKDKNVKALVLEIDTPGGSATASDQMYHRLQKFKSDLASANRTTPVIVSMGGMATSGGYYVSCGADYLFAQPQTMTANIGVIFPRFNVSGLLNKYGVEETTIVATGGDYKNAGSMFAPEDAKGRAYLQGLVDTTFTQFKNVVMSGRKGKLPSDTKDIFNGRVYMADDALKLGLIDKIGYRDDAYAYAKSAAQLSDMKVIRFVPSDPPGAGLFGADSSSNLSPASAKGGANSINVNGLNIDGRNLSDLIAPRPLYLWRGN